MKSVILASLIVLSGISGAFAFDGYFSSDGSYGYRMGDTIYHSDGSTSIQMGDTIFNSDGTCTHIY